MSEDAQLSYGLFCLGSGLMIGTVGAMLRLPIWFIIIGAICINLIGRSLFYE